VVLVQLLWVATGQRSKLKGVRALLVLKEAAGSKLRRPAHHI